jgi:hypothetical protein
VDNRGGGNDLARVQNGTPNQLTEYINWFRTYSRVRYNAFYAQASGRWTADAAGPVRYDHSWAYPEQSIGGVVHRP